MQRIHTYLRYFLAACAFFVIHFMGIIAQIPDIRYTTEELEKRILADTRDARHFNALAEQIVGLASDSRFTYAPEADPRAPIYPYLKDLYALAEELGGPYPTLARITELHMNAQACPNLVKEERQDIVNQYKSIADSIGYGDDSTTVDLRLRLYTASYFQCDTESWHSLDSNSIIANRLYDIPTLSDAQRIEISLYLLLTNFISGKEAEGREVINQVLRTAETAKEAYKPKFRLYMMLGDFFEQFTGDDERAEEMYTLANRNLQKMDPILTDKYTGLDDMRIKNFINQRKYEEAIAVLDTIENNTYSDLSNPPSSNTVLYYTGVRLELCSKMENSDCQATLNTYNRLLAEETAENPLRDRTKMNANAQAGLYYHFLEQNDRALNLLDDAYQGLKNIRFPNLNLHIDAFEVYAKLLEERELTAKAMKAHKTLGWYYRQLIGNSESSTSNLVAFELDVSENKLARQRAEQESEFVKLEADSDRRFYGTLLGGLGLLFTVGGYFFYRSRRDAQHIAEQKITVEKSLEEKEVLLREIHHRVKNNLQIISGMLTKQARISADPGLQKMVDEGKERINSMALIHQNLYESDQLSGVNIRAYLEELSENIIKSQNGANVELDLKVSDEILDLDTAIPVGLMLNELLTNSYKYAFPEDTKGKVTVALSRKEDNSYEMRVTDNGTGITDQARFKSGKTLGVNLIRGLARQLRGSVEWLERQQGTEVLVSFKTA